MPTLRARRLLLVSCLVILTLLAAGPVTGQNTFGGQANPSPADGSAPVMSNDQGDDTRVGRSGKKADNTPPKADKNGGLELNAAGFVRHLLGTLFAKDPSQLETDFIKNWGKESTAKIEDGLHPAHLVCYLLTFFHGLDCRDKRGGDQRYTKADTKPAIPFACLVALNRRPKDPEARRFEEMILQAQSFESFLCRLFNRDDCPWKKVFGRAKPRDPGNAPAVAPDAFPGPPDTTTPNPPRTDLTPPAPKADGSITLKIPQIYQGKNRLFPATSCANTSLAMVMQFFGKNVTPDKLAGPCKTDNKGTDMNQLVPVARGMGFPNAQIRDKQTLSSIEKEVAAGNPVICGIEVVVNGKTSGHAVVVKGFDARGNVITNDPGRPEVHYVYNRREFINMWSKMQNLTVTLK